MAISPGKARSGYRTQKKCALDSATNVKPRTGPPLRTLVRGPSVVAAPSVAVRAKPTVPRTAPWPRFPSAMRPWTPQHDALQRNKVTHHGTET
jgi:hypothetical protein